MKAECSMPKKINQQTLIFSDQSSRKITEFHIDKIFAFIVKSIQLKNNYFKNLTGPTYRSILDMSKTIVHFSEFQHNDPGQKRSDK